MPLTSDLIALENRLAKNVRHIAKWARRQHIHCYRLYDCDIPAFPLAIDCYTQHPMSDAEEALPWLHLQEFDTGWQQSPEDYLLWQQGVMTVVSSVCDVPPERIIFKLRARQRSEDGGRAQYQKTGEQGVDFVVSEGAAKLWVNLQAYLDTGLFLDHRPLRLWAAAQAHQKRVLNLFAYTGAFSVHAALGGAMSSETVDLSNTYQAWMARNFELNQIDRQRHQLVRADVFAYLNQAMAQRKQFDLIVLDPPTFSNSKKMLEVLDIQRDHSRLIQDCLALLAMQGKMIFSTNYRGFKLDETWHNQPDISIREVSGWSVPEDFRDRKIHRAWLLTRN